MTSEQTKCPCCGRMTRPKGTVEIDLTESLIWFEGRSIETTRRLSKLAHILAERMPDTVPEDVIASRMWGDAEIDVMGNLKVAVCQLRAKLKPLRLAIVNTWGIGYRLEVVAPAVSRTEGFSTVTGENYAQA